MNNVTINITGLNKQKIKVFQQAMDRLNLISEPEPLSNATPWYIAKFDVTEILRSVNNLPIDMQVLIFDCKKIYGVNLTTVRVNQKKYLGFVANNLPSLTQAIAHVFYNLK